MTKLLMSLAILSVALVGFGGRRQDDVSAELKKLRGSWRLVAETDDGRNMPPEEVKKYNILTFDIAGRWKVEIDGKVVGQGTARIDPTTTPKTIDYTFTLGESAGSGFAAIYELEGDSFRHCGVLQGARPSEFSSKPGSGQILTTFHRVKE